MTSLILSSPPSTNHMVFCLMSAVPSDRERLVRLETRAKEADVALRQLKSYVQLLKQKAGIPWTLTHQKAENLHYACVTYTGGPESAAQEVCLLALCHADLMTFVLSRLSVGELKLTTDY